jgi:hypothetical protein
MRFGLAAHAIESVVDVLGRTGVEAGDDTADIEAEGVAAMRAQARRGFDQDLARHIVLAAQHGRLCERTGSVASAMISTALLCVPLPESPNTKSAAFCSQKSITFEQPW